MEDKNYVLCAWCGEEFPEDYCRREIDLGYICKPCEEAIKARGEDLHFVDEEFPLDEAKKKKCKHCNSVTYTTGDPQRNIDHFNKMLVGKEENNHTDGLPSCGLNPGESAGGSEGSAMGEALEIDEDQILSRKAKQYIELPPAIKLIPQEEAEDFISDLQPQEQFRVGYATPLYFYKALLDRFVLVKCTEMTGSTGVDFRDANIDSEVLAFDDPQDILNRASTQAANPNGSTIYHGKNGELLGADINYGNSSVKSTHRGMQKRYGQINKTVEQDPILFYKDDQAKAAKVPTAVGNLETTLFYPAENSNPKTKYYIKLNQRLETSPGVFLYRWTDWIETDRETLEATIFPKLDDLAKKDVELKRAGELVSGLKQKIRQTLEADAMTTNDTTLSKGTINYDGYYKKDVRSLYTGQFYYLSNDKKTIGKTLIESLNKLTEAKRYVRRYYVRPQDVFCSNKKEIIKVLIDAYNDKQDCTIYTLNNQGDIKDTGKLTSADIIYTFSKGVLKDKNDVPVFDYDLYIKHEEKRDSIKPNQVSDAKFNDVYDDRMTDQTVVEDLDSYLKLYDIYLNDELLMSVEAISEEEAERRFAKAYPDIFNESRKELIIKDHENEGTFDQDFDDINVYGENLTEAKHEEERYCCICGEEIEGYGNNAEPVKSGKCCDACNVKFVLPARLEQMHAEKDN